MDAWNKGVQAAPAAGGIIPPTYLGAPTAGAHGQITSDTAGKCADVAAGGTADGTKVQLYTCNGTGAQIWQAYQGRCLNPAPGRCLDDTRGSATDGTRLELWGCKGGANQRFAVPVS